MSDENETTDRAVYDPKGTPPGPAGRVIGPTDDMQSQIPTEPQPGADEDGFGGDAPEPAEAPNEGTVKDLTAEAKDNPELAAEILAAEQELPEDEQRSTLVEALEPVAAEAVPEGAAGDVEKWVGTDKDRAQRALDAEKAGQKRKGLTAFLEGVLASEDDES